MLHNDAWTPKPLPREQCAPETGPISVCEWIQWTTSGSSLGARCVRAAMVPAALHTGARIVAIETPRPWKSWIVRCPPPNCKCW